MGTNEPLQSSRHLLVVDAWLIQEERRREALYSHSYILFLKQYNPTSEEEKCHPISQKFALSREDRGGEAQAILSKP
jgi:hypothetical protein